MSSRSLNKVTLIGNLTRDPELRYTPAGTAVCTIGLATNRSWTTQTGETKEETEFHRIVSWNKLAELCAQLLTKGRKVYVEGRLSTRSWTGQDGNQRTTTEIVIEDMILLDSRRVMSEGVAAVAPTVPTAQPVSQPVVSQPQTPVQTDKAQDETDAKDTKKKSSVKEKGKEEAKPEKVKEDSSENKSASEEITPEDIPF